MPSTYTQNLGIELPADGELDGVWGDVVNENMDILDRATNGSVTLTLTGTSSTLTTSDGALSDGQYKLLVLGGTPSGTHTITISPNNAQKIYFVRNTTAQSVVFTQGSGGNVTIATGDSAIIYSDGAGASAAVVNITNDFAMSSVKITGGTIDGTVIGGTSAAAGTFTTANATTVDTTNIEVTTLKAKDGTAAGSIADSTGVVTLASSVLTTTDINGGTVDGAVIGGSSAAAITGTTITATGDVTIADKIIHAGDTNTAIRFPAADTVTVETSGAERMRITSAGNVGIGTTTPGSALEVNSGTSDFAALFRSTDSTAYISFRDDTTSSSTSVYTGAIGNDFAAAGATNLRLYTNSTERMRITSTGNVGIGNTGPLTQLQVGPGLTATIDDGAGTQFTPQIINTQTSGVVGISVYSNDGTDNPRAGLFMDPTNNVWGLSSRYSAGTGRPFIIRNNNAERMRIDASGNVGIGTSSPTDRLEVSGNILSVVAGTSSVAARSGDNTNYSQIRFRQTASESRIESFAAGTGTFAPMTFHVNSSERMRIDSSGNVGIGVGAPAARLDVTGAVNSLQARFGNVANRGLEISTAIFNTRNDAASILNARSDGIQGTLIFQTDSTERMRIDNVGNVGIGTTSPAGLLEVFDVLTVPARNTTTIASKRGLSIYNNQSSGQVDTTLVYGNTANSYLAIGNHNGTSYAERMRITSSGNVGIGTSSPTVRLDVRDSIAVVSVAANSIAYFSNEDTTSTATTRINLRSHQGDSVRERAYLEAGLEGVSGGYLSLWTRPTGSGITEKVRVTAAGSVGIGTASPASIVGGTDTSPVLSIGGTDSTLTTGDKAGSLSFITNDASYTVTYADGVTGEIASIAQTATGAAYGLAFYTGTVTGSNRAERVRITAEGNVGIGTTTPDTRLTISSSGANGLNLAVDQGNSLLSARLMLSNGTSGQSALLMNNTGGLVFHTGATPNSSSGTERMRITSAGNVVIGNGETSATPTNGVLQATGGSGTDIVGATLNIQGGRGTGSGAGGPITFSTSPAGTTGTTLNAATERMRIDSSGNVGIGTSSPAQRLHVVGQARIVGSVSSGRLDIFGATSATDGAFSLNSTATRSFTIRDEYSAVERMRIDSSGNVGIGTSSPADLLHVSKNGDAIVRVTSADGLGDAAVRFYSGATYKGQVGWDQASDVLALYAPGNATTPALSVGTGGIVYRNFPAQTVESAAATLTIAELLTGIIQYTGALATLTLPTGTDIEGGLPATPAVNLSFDFSVINTGSGTVTLGTATGLTLTGSMAVAAAASGLFRVRKTATNTYTIYRLA